MVHVSQNACIHNDIDLSENKRLGCINKTFGNMKILY